MPELPVYLYSEVKKEANRHSDYTVKDRMDWAMFISMNSCPRSGRTLANTAGLEEVFERLKNKKNVKRSKRSKPDME